MKSGSFTGLMNPTLYEQTTPVKSRRAVPGRENTVRYRGEKVRVWDVCRSAPVAPGAVTFHAISPHKRDDNPVPRQLPGASEPGAMAPPRDPDPFSPGSALSRPPAVRQGEAPWRGADAARRVQLRLLPARPCRHAV